MAGEKVEEVNDTAIEGEDFPVLFHHSECLWYIELSDRLAVTKHRRNVRIWDFYL